MKRGIRGVLIGSVFGLLTFYLSKYLTILCKVTLHTNSCRFISIEYTIPLVTGIDYFFVLYKFYNSFLIQFITAFIAILFSGLIGYLITENSIKKKLIVVFIFLLIFVPLSVHSNYLKYRDNKILFEERFDDMWYLSSYEPCEKLSIFKDAYKSGCSRSKLFPQEEVVLWQEFKEKDSIMRDCLRQKKSTGTPPRSSKCLVYTAVQRQNIDICNYTPYGPTICIMDFAIDTKNPTLCPKPQKGLNIDINNTVYSSDYYHIIQNNTLILICNTFWDRCIAYPVEEQYGKYTVTETNTLFIIHNNNQDLAYTKEQFFNEDLETYKEYALEKQTYYICVDLINKNLPLG